MYFYLEVITFRFERLWKRLQTYTSWPPESLSRRLNIFDMDMPYCWPTMKTVRHISTDRLVSRMDDSCWIFYLFLLCIENTWNVFGTYLVAIRYVHTPVYQCRYSSSVYWWFFFKISPSPLWRRKHILWTCSHIILERTARILGLEPLLLLSRYVTCLLCSVYTVHLSHPSVVVDDMFGLFLSLGFQRPADSGIYVIVAI